MRNERKKAELFGWKLKSKGIDGVEDSPVPRRMCTHDAAICIES